ncbi:DUF4169 family protein [Methylobacterium durans]|uniref:DUF4169 domain-containing protein n=1 Tax=Methylobacterium durans TaxID=2202825 RepID=A0A2U8W8D1_9HYPH|nr:DUF4169 family protein [Methylobacterium durans]AWN41891.1 DUF4169 domain-containing protein [Methylobacterium durans]MEA1832950.1 DUF4169 family protein [Methylobacterium durans]
MGEIINLRQARKSRARAAKAEEAAQNRVLFGRPKTAKTLAEARKSLERDRHEGHRLGNDDPEA